MGRLAGPYNCRVNATRAARNTRIDLLRGVAIGLVLVLHFSLTYRVADSPLSALMPVSFIRAAVDNGNFGVTMFFAISGFLITSNTLGRYARLRDVRLREFYVFRGARILPPLILALIVIVPLGLAGLPSFDNLEEGHVFGAAFFALALLSVLTFWHNVLMQQVGYFNYCLNIYWSLSVEEVFYLLFPLACVMLRRESLVVALCLVLIGVAPFYRAAHGGDELYYLYGYCACFDAIAFGCLAALASRRLRPPGRLARALWWLACLAVAVTYLRGIDGHEHFGFTLIAAFTALALFASKHCDGQLKNPLARVIGWFGSHSYELYLFHIIVLGLLREALPRRVLASVDKLPLLAAFMLASALSAAAVARLYADPLNAGLRRRMLQRAR